jgi:tripeptidyl-peptidase I
MVVRRTDINSYRIFYNGSATADAGTSAAAPVIAGIVGLLNDARLKVGKPTMGFINPWLYNIKNGVGLTDITSGSAVGCTGFDPHGKPVPGGGVIPYATWNGTQGWDPATGLGVPNFVGMLHSAIP